MRTLEIILSAATLAAVGGMAQETPVADPSVTNGTPATVEVEAEDEKKWSFSLSAYAYSLPDDDDFVQPTITADRGWLHLEARFNYEDQDTGSAWLGYNVSGGKKIEWELTPMLGGVFGETSGIAPGYKGSVNWWKLELYSEGEFIFDSEVHSDSFFYSWSELSLSPVEWFRVGLVAQRTRAYESSVDIERGFLIGVTFWKADLSLYVLNPDESKPTLVTAVTLSF